MTPNVSLHYHGFLQFSKVNKGLQRTKVWALSLAGHSFGPLLVLELRVMAMSGLDQEVPEAMSFWGFFPSKHRAFIWGTHAALTLRQMYTRCVWKSRVNHW